MAKLSILCGFPGDTQQRLLQRFRQVVRRGPPGCALWLGPNYRAIVEVCHTLQLPQFLTLQDFADEIVRVNDPRAQPISSLQCRLFAAEVVSSLQAKNGLAYFQGVVDTHGFAETVFQFLSELKQNEIHSSDLEKAIAQAQSAGQDSLFSTRDKECALIYKEYAELLNRHQLYDMEGRQWYARDLLLQKRFQPFEQVRAVFLHGFTSFTRTQLEMLEALSQHVEELWLTSPDQEDTERAELFAPARRTFFHLANLFPTLEHVETTIQAPAGLAHLRQEIFRPLKKVRQSDNADGISLIEAPGLAGEARLVARCIKQLLNAGSAADEILVVIRDLRPYAELLHEVFDDYAIPVDIEGTQPLLRNAAVSTLLRTWRIPDEGYTFAQVTALLRSTYFSPGWPEVQSAPDAAQQSEILLRLLDEPRGKEAYLRAVQRWAEKPQPGLEDEQAEESRRQRMHQLARTCRPFLERFLHVWDQAPLHATLQEHIRWLRHLADDLGITRTAESSACDRTALARFWNELDHWLGLHQKLYGSQRTIDRNQFDRLLHAVALHAGMARTRRGPGKVRILSALLARSLSADHIFLMGLSERNFPQMTAPESLFEDQQQQALKKAGLELPAATEMLPEEMLLFYQIISNARKHLTFSYPAVDEKGQELLPSSFLAQALDAFQPNTIDTIRRSMPVDRYFDDMPLSLAEYRIQAAHALKSDNSAWPLPVPLDRQLQAALELARERFETPHHGVYDGLFNDPQIIAEVARIFGSRPTFSPTTLENYVACPFKFFLQHVLKLEVLEDPSEEIESTDRGLAVHRAMARLHRKLRADGVHEPAEEVDEHLLREIALAVEESSTQISPAAERLWRLEGERLKKVALRYRAHWLDFLKPWLKQELRLQPELFEAGFGLPPADGELMAEPLVIAWEGLEVCISGRIDRVDTVELPDGSTGFWIIDYKTGRSGYYTGKDLKEFRKLQLTLYALAAEQVLLAGRNARPLGLAYWLVADTGPKIALPGHRSKTSWVDETNAWQILRTQLQRWVVEIVSRIRHGEFALKPRSEHCTTTCDFSQICRISQLRGVAENKSWYLPLPVLEEDKDAE